MLNAHKITYNLPDKELLFENVSFSVQKHDKVALIGNNGVGKSTLLKILAGQLRPSGGIIEYEFKPYYAPQHYGQFDDQTVAEALKIKDKLMAYNQILDGNVTKMNLEILNDDWSIQERCQTAFSFWGIEDLSLNRKMSRLSGGQKTKVFLAGIMIHQANILLMDEPTNHLDHSSREMLYQYIRNSKQTMLVVSHDRKLLDLLSPVYEMERGGIKVYGGNYSFYKSQKEHEEQVLKNQLGDREKALKMARKAERASLERKQRQDSRGKKKKEKEGVSKMAMKKLKNQAESSSSKLKEVHAEKIGSISRELKDARSKLPDISKIKMNFENSSLHKGKVLATAENINFSYSVDSLWYEPLSFKIFSNDRISIKGDNGSGKTTLLKIILGQLNPTIGEMKRADFHYVFIDQDYSLIRDDLSVYDQAQLYNRDAMMEHEIKIRLHRYLFDQDSWDKSCSTLSGGEKMRLLLCCLMISNRAPDIFVLDEPTNNLDIQNMEILSKAINDYQGTVIVISHDHYFLNEIRVNKYLELS